VTGIGKEPEVRKLGYDPVRAFLIPIVEDRGEYASALGRVVMRCGHDLRTALDGVEGAEVALEFRPDVVLLDIGLPGPDGYEVARRIREQPWGTGVTLIALTAYGQELDERRFHDAGFDAHLAKPVDIEVLVTLIGRSPPSQT
jgi:CheY-like chemotaxis protein